MIWIPRYPDSTSPPAELPAWAAELSISPFLARLLWERGLESKEEMLFFLNPGLRYLAPPKAWPGLEHSAGVLADGLLQGKKLLVWGDYDVDGLTATALVVEFMAAHGFTAEPYIPSRLEEGYGLSSERLEEFYDQGFRMLLTVDCGIANVDEVKRARDLGFTVLISDHHLPGETLPEAHAICAPTLNECPCGALSGVGVAFFLMAGVNACLAEAGKDKADLKPLLDLVALGTLADVVNVNGQNRVLIKNGLLHLSSGTRPGIAALKSAARLQPSGGVSAGQVVFTLAPRLNAAGRLGESGSALRLLLTRDRQEAAALAEELERLNRQRREEEDRIVQEARNAAEQAVQEGAMGLVLYGADWHMGVIGIVASRVVEEWRRPTLILCDNGDRIKGSGRSLEGFDLHAALKGCEDLLLSFGGHRMAAGLSLSPKSLQEFRARFDQAVKRDLGNRPSEEKLKTDGELKLSQGVDFTCLKELELLQPFGMGNAEPVFVSDPLILRNVNNRNGMVTLEVHEKESGLTARAKIWKPKREFPPESRGRRIRLAYSPRIDRYNGAANVEIRVRDWQLEE